ncbi:MAG: hypothetical protein AB1427_14770 [Thermodesulfobacteriota bacterium]
MGKNRKKNKIGYQIVGQQQTHLKFVDSLLDSMQEGNEYGSIVSLAPRKDLNLLDEVAKGLNQIENIRKRPCLSYVGNVVRNDGESGIDSTDDLPFAEMVQKVPAEIKKVDLFLATRGGSAHQVSRFVNHLRSRFTEIDFIIPSFCMSAGTLFALSGDNIWMTERACLGPIDPQVPTKDGRFVPAQALLLLVDQLQKKGDDAKKNGTAIPWTAIRIIDTIDKKELGDAITASSYSTMMATQFLKNYKFRNWHRTETRGELVTQKIREDRAMEIAAALASHDRWLNHGHAISRDVLWEEIRLRIERPKNDFNQAIIRLWALFNWIFDKTPIFKTIISKEYKYCKHITLVRN